MRSIARSRRTGHARHCQGSYAERDPGGRCVRAIKIAASLGNVDPVMHITRTVAAEVAFDSDLIRKYDTLNSSAATSQSSGSIGPGAALKFRGVEKVVDVGIAFIGPRRFADIHICRHYYAS